MISESIETKRSRPLLKTALAGNGIFSLISGLVLAVGAPALSALLGIAPPILLQIVGGTLIPYGALLLWVASRQPINHTLAVTAIVLDIGWVLGSVLLLLVPVVPFTITGKWVVAILADIVALFAIVQYIGLRRLVRP